MMKSIVLLGVVALFGLSAGPAFAVPMCEGPRFDEVDANGRAIFDEEELAALAEIRLHQLGIAAENTRFWNGCLQTFVRENGHTVIRYFDPDTFEEVPVN